MTRRKSVFIQDPKRPRSYLNSYMLFFLDVRPALLQNNPKMKFSKIGKAVGQLWRSLPKATKDKYRKREELGRKRYEKRLSFYRQPSQEELFELYGVRPKRFANAYCYYVKRNFDKALRRHPSFDFVQVSKLLSRSWKGLSEKKRAPYVHKFVADWRRWKREMHLWRGGHFRHNIQGCCHCCQGTATKTYTTPANLQTFTAGDCQKCASAYSAHSEGHHQKSKLAGKKKAGGGDGAKKKGGGKKVGVGKGKQKGSGATKKKGGGGAKKATKKASKKSTGKKKPAGRKKKK